MNEKQIYGNLFFIHLGNSLMCLSNTSDSFVGMGQKGVCLFEEFMNLFNQDLVRIS